MNNLDRTQRADVCEANFYPSLFIQFTLRIHELTTNKLLQNLSLVFVVENPIIFSLTAEPNMS